jgi:predicted site-specific integrase-resolvase
MAETDGLVISEERAAQSLGLSARTLQRWRVEGRGPRFVKLGKRVAYTEQALRDYVDKNQHGSTSEAAA